MATVVHLPREQSTAEILGSSLGGALSQFAVADMQKREQQRKLQLVQSSLDAIRQVGSRDKALEMVLKLPFEDVKDMQSTRQWVDEMYPPADRTPHEVTTYDAQGNKLPVFVPRGDLTKLNTGDPSVLPPGRSLSPPAEMEQFFKPGTATAPPTSTGKRPISQRTPGEFTLKELELQDKQRTAIRQEEKDNRDATRLDIQIAQMQRQFDKDNKLRTKELDNEARKDAKDDLSNLIKANNHLKDRLNVKKSIGADGVVLLDFEGDSDKQRKYGVASDLLADAITANKGNINKAVSEVLGRAGLDEPAKKSAPAAEAPQKGGLLSRAFDAVTGKSSEKKDEGGEVAAKAKAAWGSYEPQKYEYRVTNGKVQRKLKNG